MGSLKFDRIGVLENLQYEYFAQRVAAGAPPDQAYYAAGYRAKDVRQAVYKLKNRPEVRKRIMELAAEAAEQFRCLTLGSTKERLMELEDRWRRMKALIRARAGDPRMQQTPGGETGLLVLRQKVLGNGTGTIDEYCFDHTLMEAMLALEAQAAKELGQWTQKLEVTATFNLVERLNAGRQRVAEAVNAKVLTIGEQQP